jgi:multicomponent Na+:H+ antiporter subunit B
MNARTRRIVFVGAAAVLLPLFVRGFGGLAPFGAYPGPYGDVLNAVAVNERHALNVATAVIFDYRGFDTLGEEFILFTCVTGVVLLLRREPAPGPRGNKGRGRQPRRLPAVVPQATEALQLLARGAIGLLLVTGAYVIATGHLGVGGGFQGGIILASAWLLAWLAHGPDILDRIARSGALEWLEAIGAGGFVLTGAAGVVAGRAFLTNVLPLGAAGELFSAGAILWLSVLVGLEVCAGVVLLLREFARPPGTPGE